MTKEVNERSEMALQSPDDDKSTKNISPATNHPENETDSANDTMNRPLVDVPDPEISEVTQLTDEENATVVGESKATEDDSVGDNNSEEKEFVIDDDDGEVDLGDISQLDSDGRNRLFEMGLTYDKTRKKNCALKCYIACLKDLKPDSRFPLLPQCLHNIADIYYQKDDFDKAVHFIQAEKVYYESALIDTTEIQARIDESQNTENGDQVEQNMDTVRAEEYEHLAKLCLDKDQPQLALEYAGKATKIRQQILGENHPVTVQSLDFFASVYAKVGQEQYQESMKKLSEPEGESSGNTAEASDPSSPVSILRKRKTADKEEKRVRFDESLVQNLEHGNDEQLAKKVLWALLIICCVLMLILGIYLYCKLHPHSEACSSLRTSVYYAYMRIKYIYYHYRSPGDGAKYT